MILIWRSKRRFTPFWTENTRTRVSMHTHTHTHTHTAEKTCTQQNEETAYVCLSQLILEDCFSNTKSFLLEAFGGVPDLFHSLTKTGSASHSLNLTKSGCASQSHPNWIHFTFSPKLDPHHILIQTPSTSNPHPNWICFSLTQTQSTSNVHPNSVYFTLSPKLNLHPILT